MKIACINGINTDGSTSTDLLAKELERRGHAVVDVNYPITRWWQAGKRGIQLDRAQYLIDATDDGDIVVAHSFGCLVTRRAMQKDRKFSHAFLFSPADESDTYYPYEAITGDGKIHIIHNPSDKALWWGHFIPNHDFGELGRIGYEGPSDSRIVEYRAQYYHINDMRHSFYFSKSSVVDWADYIELNACLT